MTNHIKLFTFFLTLGFATLFLVSCNKDEDDGPGGGDISAEEQAVLEDILGDWTLTSVTQNDADPQVGTYVGTELSINADIADGSNKTYSISGSEGPALPNASSAPWSFLEGSLISGGTPVMEIQGGIQLRINEHTATTLVLQQDVDEELEAGRVATIGRYIYTFTK